MFLQAVSHFISSELLSILFSTPIQLYKTNKLDYFSLCNIKPTHRGQCQANPPTHTNLWSEEGVRRVDEQDDAMMR